MENSIHYGKQWIADIRARSFLGKVKSKISYAFWFIVKWGAVSVFLFAGWCSLGNIIQFV